LHGFNVPVFDADAAVHRLYRSGSPMLDEVNRAFPDCLDPAGSVDRGKLGGEVFGDRAAMRRLESIVHPWTFRMQRWFLMQRCREGWPVVALDIPLLFETGAQARMDATLVVETSGEVQYQRAMRRPGMTEGKLMAIRKQQMPTGEKCRLADFTIASGHDRGATTPAIARILMTIAARPAKAWPERWNSV
jgi:dephospho-CoA kinase